MAFLFGGGAPPEPEPEPEDGPPEMGVYIERILGKIHAETYRRDEELRSAIDETIAAIRKQREENEGRSAKQDADPFFRPLQLACQQKNSRIRAIALDAIQKLIAWGYLCGMLKVVQGEQTRYLIDIVVESVCECRDDATEQIQLQMLKTLLTAATAPQCRVHAHSLLLTIRSCYNVFLVSRAPANRTTARATLTQIISKVFKMMEEEEGRTGEVGGAVGDGDGGEGGGGSGGGEAGGGGDGGEEKEEGGKPSVLFGWRMYGEVEDMLGFKGEDGKVVGGGQGSGGSGGSRKSGGSGVVQFGQRVGADEDEEEQQGFQSPFHRDAFLVFRALCRMSMRGDEGGSEGGSGGGSSVPVASRILSLDLLHNILRNAGDSFRGSPRFLAAIRQYLARSLLKNSLSAHAHLVDLSLGIFLVLVTKFREDLAEELEVFLASVFLAVLDSAHSSAEQKQRVLDVFDQISRDHRALVELFLNYDCAAEEEGRERIFERVVQTLAGIAQGRGSAAFNAATKTAAEGETLRRAALRTLATVAGSLRTAVDIGAAPRAVLLRRMASGTSEAVASVTEGASTGVTASGGAVEDRSSGSGSGDVGGGGEVEESGGDGGEDEEVESVGALSASAKAAAAAAASATAGGGGARHSVSSSYELAKKRRAELERAALRFRMKPKDGVKYLVQIGRIQEGSAEDVARVFLELRDVLDKTGMGEYMGEEKEFNVRVMHEYVELLDFEGDRFDDAIRKFLAGFRLPGEAQKIDRIMEKFAEVYCRTNPGVFPNADTAFVLAYSVIMLHTDAHNKAILPEKKMKKEDFVRNNRGIANGQDLPRSFLEELYDSITTKEMTLKDDDVVRESLPAARTRTAREREVLFSKERSRLLQEGEAKMRSKQARGGRRRLAEAPVLGGTGTMRDPIEDGSAAAAAEDVLRPMVDVAWGPLLAAFAVNLEHSDDPRVVESCLDGVLAAIRAGGVLGLETERAAFITCLARFSQLDSPSVPMHTKNIHCAVALVKLAQNEGEWLGSDWGIAHRCLSSIAYLHGEATGGPADAAFFKSADGGRYGAAAAHAAHARGGDAKAALAAQEAALALRRNALQVSAAIPESALSRVYTGSVSLSSEALADFVTQLARVSMAELHLPGSDMDDALPSTASSSTPTPSTSSSGSTQASAPRVYSLQKVVEVADYNLEKRGRMTWAKVWRLLSRFFTRVGCHGNPQLAMYAIDSLKQLSSKFLEKDELGGFQFQRVFLAPFAAIMEAQPRAAAEVRELILHVFSHLVRAKAARFRSGWRTLLAVHAAAARDAAGDDGSSLVPLAFETVHSIVLEHFDRVVHADAFTDLVRALVAFASNGRADLFVAMRSVDHLAAVGAHLARGRVPLGDTTDRIAQRLIRLQARLRHDAAVASGNPFADSAAPVPLRASSDDSAMDADDDDEDAEARLRELSMSAEFVDAFYDLDGPENDDIRATRSPKKDKPVEGAVGNESGGVGGIGGGAAEGTPVKASGGGALGEERKSGEDVELEGDVAEGGGGEAVIASPAPAATPVAEGGLVSEGSSGGWIRRFSDARNHTAVWWPLLTGLMHLIGDRRPELRTRALDALFALLRRFGPGFNAELWTLIYQGVLLPIFDDVRHARDKGKPDGVAAEHSWLRTTCMPALSALVQLQVRFFARLRPQFPALLGLLEACIDQEIEGLARIGVACLQLLLRDAGTLLKTQDWDLVVSALERLFACTAPRALLEAREHLLGPSLERRQEILQDQKRAKERVKEVRGALGDALAALARIDAAATASVPAPDARAPPSNPFSVDKTPTNPFASTGVEGKASGGGEEGAESVDSDDSEGESGEGPKDVLGTPFGRGILLEAPREEDGVAVVQLEFGILYTTQSEEWSTTRLKQRVRELREQLEAAEEKAEVANEAVVALSAPPPPLPFNSTRVVTQCVVQLELIQALGSLADAHLASLQPLQAQGLLRMLNRAAKFARTFNADVPLRGALHRAGLMRFAKRNRVPTLLRQETTASRELLRLVLGLVSDGVHSAMARRRLRALARGVVTRFVRLDADMDTITASESAEASTAAATASGASVAPNPFASGTTDWASAGPGAARELHREHETYAPLVTTLLDGIGSLPEGTFREEAWWLYPLLSDLLQASHRSVRVKVAHFFRTSVKDLIDPALLQSPPDATEDDVDDEIDVGSGV